MQINEWIALTAKQWPFDNAHYPGLDELQRDKKRIFAIKHILMRQMKTCGELAELIEACDHGEVLHGIRAVSVVENMLINVFRLMDIIGVKIDHLNLPSTTFPRPITETVPSDQIPPAPESHD